VSSSSGFKVRVDQSHCNLALSRYLSDIGWTVLFRDPGRATRGGRGTQGEVLRVFERTGLPIPDIAACSGERLLLIEVDKSLRNNAESFKTYRHEASSLLLAFRGMSTGDVTLSTLMLGFCKVGHERTPEQKLAEFQLDLFASVASNAALSLVWADQ